MSDLQLALAVVLGLFALAVIGGGLWAAFRSTDQDKRIERLKSERDDLLSRLNFIEPKLKVVEDQNALLMAMHNPAEQIADLRAQEAENHRKTYALLEQQHQTLRQIDKHLTDREAP